MDSCIKAGAGCRQKVFLRSRVNLGMPETGIFYGCGAIKRGMGRGVEEMVCTKCGARLMETDQFCPKCGAKRIREKKCPDCGEILRDGVKFCPGCGRVVGAKKRRQPAPDETLDIPIEAIERNILSETEAEIKKDRRADSTLRRPSAAKEAPARRVPAGGASERSRASAGGSSRSAQTRRAEDGTPTRKAGAAGAVSEEARSRKKQPSVPAPPPRRKKPVYREEIWEEDDWDEEEDWEDDDWDEEEEEGIDVITVMTVVVGCVLLVVLAFLGYQMLRQYLPRNYDRAAEEQQEEQESEESEEVPEQDGEETDGQGQTDGTSEGGSSRLMVVSDVNVRDQPSTSGTNVLKVAKAGETYVCNGVTEDKEWYEIVLEDGTKGYVFHEYISIE